MSQLLRWKWKSENPIATGIHSREFSALAEGEDHSAAGYAVGEEELALNNFSLTSLSAAVRLRGEAGDSKRRDVPEGDIPENGVPDLLRPLFATSSERGG